MKLELIGNKFNRWEVIKESHRKRYWLCVCECGLQKEVREDHLVKGGSKSCGCLRDELARVQNKPVHGHTINRVKTPEYRAWNNMIRRCEKESVPEYIHYGARGIKVCDSWHKFENFLNDMGIKPSKKHTLERINNDGNYEPSNCKWATFKEQSKNKRPNINNVTGVRGVNLYKRTGKYKSRINVDGKEIHLGYFDSIEEAKEVRKLAEIKYWNVAP